MDHLGHPNAVLGSEQGLYILSCLLARGVALSLYRLPPKTGGGPPGKAPGGPHEGLRRGLSDLMLEKALSAIPR